MTAGRGELPDSFKTIREGLLVEKSLDVSDRETSVEFRVVSKRDGAVSIRIEDAVPPSVAPAAVAFDPGPDGSWTADEGGVFSFRSRVAPGGELAFGYTVDGGEAGAPDGFRGSPTVDFRPVDDGTARADRSAIEQPSGSRTGQHRGDAPTESDGGSGGLLAAVKRSVLPWRSGTAVRTNGPGADEDAGGSGDQTRGADTLAGSRGDGSDADDADTDADADPDADEEPPSDVDAATGNDAGRRGAARGSVQADGVTVERTLDVREAGIVVAHRVTVDEERGPVEVRIVDPLPSAWWVEGIGVDPSFRPRRSEVGVNQIAFADEVVPGTPLEVRYGVALRDRADGVDLERCQRVRPPRIESVRAVGSGDATAMADGQWTPSGVSARAPPPPPAGLFSDVSGDGVSGGKRARSETDGRSGTSSRPPTDGEREGGPDGRGTGGEPDGREDSDAPLAVLLADIDGGADTGEERARLRAALGIDAIEADLGALRSELAALRDRVHRDRRRR